jgi:hypothetical protein
MAVLNLRNKVYRKDIVAESEGFGIEVIVTLSRWVIGRLVDVPCDIGMGRCRNTPEGILADIVWAGKTCVHITAIWLWFVTDIGWWTTPS